MIAGAIFLVGAAICFQNELAENERSLWALFGITMLVLGCLTMSGALAE